MISPVWKEFLITVRKQLIECLRSGVFKDRSGSHPGADAHGHDSVPSAEKQEKAR